MNNTTYNNINDKTFFPLVLKQIFDPSNCKLNYYRSRLQWLSALKLAISYSAGTEGYQRTLLRRRQKRRKAELQEKHRRSSIIHDMDIQLQAEKQVRMVGNSLGTDFQRYNVQARVAIEIQAKELKVASEKHVEELETMLEEETQAKRDEEIVRNLQAR